MTLILEATHYLCKENKKKEREHQLDGLFTMGPIVICRCLSALHSPSSRWYNPLVVSSQTRPRCVLPGQILLSRQTLTRLLVKHVNSIHHLVCSTGNCVESDILVERELRLNMSKNLMIVIRGIR